jgi:hypothetical protein
VTSRLAIQVLVGLLFVALSTLATAAAIHWRSQPPRPVEVAPGELLVVDREALALVDLERVHSELVPSWVVARGGMRPNHFTQLRREAGRDPNLGAILDRMALLADADAVLNARELLGLVSTWNAYLDKAGQPWRMEGEILVNRGGGDDLLALRTYKVIHDGHTRVGDRDYRTLVQRRADGTTLVEPYLGHMRSWERGVILLHDRIKDYALDEIWPLLDPASTPDDPVAAAFAEPLRQAVRESLGSVVADRLESTAPARAAMIEAVASVHARHRCGSQFLVSRLPWNGFDTTDVTKLQIHAAAAADQPCPDVTPAEAETLVASSRQLQQTPALRDATERLVAWVAGAVAVHEARHAADDARLDAEGLFACSGCPSDLGRVEALEASAYLASFAAPHLGVMSMYQACALDPDRLPDRAAAVAFLAERLGTTCDQGPPPDLVERARGVEIELFGRLTPVDLRDFPVSLPVADAGVR